MSFVYIYGISVYYVATMVSKSILSVCDLLGLRLVRLCYHRLLLISGNCRFCLCSVVGERKYVIGCFYKIRPNLIVRSISKFLKYWKFLFFLVLNHPTDCPLCDQVGICEIQNTCNVFGSSLRVFGYVYTNFSFVDLGLYIRFIMSRCIHCLRCVRLMREVLLFKHWGFLGRGKSIYLGFYVKSFFNISFIDSLIKICPVGALTSKIFVFEVRPWELNRFYSLNIYSCFIDYLVLHVCNSIICRVFGLSCNIGSTSEWLFDNVRTVVYNSMYQRICLPYSIIVSWLNCFFFKMLSWNAVYILLFNLFQYISKCGLSQFVSIFLNGNLDLYGLLYIKHTFLLFNIYNFNNKYLTDLSVFYKINMQFKVNDSEFWFLVGLEFETKFLAFGLKLKELWRKSNLLIFCLGFFEFWTVPVYFLGSVNLLYWDILQGRLNILHSFLTLYSGVFLLNSFIYDVCSSSFGVLFLFELLKYFKRFFIWGVVSLFADFVGNCFLNFNFKNSLYKFSINSTIKQFFFYFNSFSFLPNISSIIPCFKCYIGMYVNRIASVSNIVLPLYSFVEKSKVLYINVLGKLRGAKSVVNKLTYSVSEFFICKFIMNIFFKVFVDSFFGRWCLSYTCIRGSDFKNNFFNIDVDFMVNAGMLGVVSVYLNVICNVLFYSDIEFDWHGQLWLSEYIAL